MSLFGQGFKTKVRVSPQGGHLWLYRGFLKHFKFKKKKSVLATSTLNWARFSTKMIELFCLIWLLLISHINSECKPLLIWRFSLEATRFLLCCYVLACDENMAVTLSIFFTWNINWNILQCWCSLVVKWKHSAELALTSNFWYFTK